MWQTPLANLVGFKVRSVGDVVKVFNALLFGKLA